MPADAAPSARRATEFHALHHADQPLLLPNAWDYASAAALFDAGFPAVGTTSLGVSAASGLPDGQGKGRAETLTLTRLLCRLPRPVTVDIEAGFSDDPGEVAELVAALAEAGAAGINLEDSGPDGLAEVGSQEAKLAAARAAAPGLFLNARTDTHWLRDEPLPLSETLDRARRYVAAGADGIFVPGLAEDEQISAVVAGAGVPVNLLYRPGGQSLARLAELGVRRVSTGSLLFRAALRATVAAATAVRDGGEQEQGIPPYPEVTALLEGAEQG